jgi:hypothetical protein
MQPSVPGSGGTTVIGAVLAEPFTFRRNVPRPVRWICALLMGPFRPAESLYLYPPETWRQPEPGNVKSWVVEVAPSAKNVTTTPPVRGSPTMTLSLDGSLACPRIFRRAGSVVGFFTWSWRPSTV